MKIYKYHGKCNVCGQKIRDFRNSKGITQTQLAARLQVEGIDLEQVAVSRIETGDRVVADYELRAFAKVFHVTMEELMEDEIYE